MHFKYHRRRLHYTTVENVIINGDLRMLWIIDYIDPYVSSSDCLILDAVDKDEALRKAIEELKTPQNSEEIHCKFRKILRGFNYG